LPPFAQKSLSEKIETAILAIGPRGANGPVAGRKIAGRKIDARRALPENFGGIPRAWRVSVAICEHTGGRGFAFWG